MYRDCISCSSPLGVNHALASFPVGTRLAFDSRRGRLWVVCGHCARWNLAPIEERWEPIEQAEMLFQQARVRVQGANIGLTHLADGTRLIRIGSPLPAERRLRSLGMQLLDERKRYLRATAGLAVLPLMGLTGPDRGGSWLLEPRVVRGPGALQLQIVLAEHAERRTLERELAAFDAAWPEAEKIAAIADLLPDSNHLPR